MWPHAMTSCVAIRGNLRPAAALRGNLRPHTASPAQSHPHHVPSPPLRSAHSLSHHRGPPLSVAGAWPSGAHLLTPRRSAVAFAEVGPAAVSMATQPALPCATPALLGAWPTLPQHSPVPSPQRGRPHLAFLQAPLQKSDLRAPTPPSSAWARFALIAKAQVAGLSILKHRFLNAEVPPVGAHVWDFCRRLCRSQARGRPHSCFLQAVGFRWAMGQLGSRGTESPAHPSSSFASGCVR